jgi:hypothetical protein
VLRLITDFAMAGVSPRVSSGAAVAAFPAG